MKRRNKFRFLSWQQRRVLLYAFLLLNLIRVALYLLTYGIIRKQMERMMSIWIYRESHNISIDFIVWVVNVAGTYSPGNAKCLVKALTAQFLLSRYGYSYELRIGVAKGASQQIEAHAWVEHQGTAIVGKLADLERFKPLATGMRSTAGARQ